MLFCTAPFGMLAGRPQRERSLKRLAREEIQLLPLQMDVVLPRLPNVLTWIPHSCQCWKMKMASSFLFSGWMLMKMLTISQARCSCLGRFLRKGLSSV